ncbi:F0F1 ATP synthase subunit B [Marivirga sp.]|uniref:F0F1 ATP synthase subunit B n=1 Tax=Marivirga sp. TaxID=2018662 RepID=UPI002D7E4892|nr:F0F1 ATP synthase subunit B [Marivirga sp.]HET8861186.1 F0F1 ATP synthase subunit B [Marivirga sp.]
MDLITPDYGLIFWTTLVFLILVFLLRAIAWKPILSALKAREGSIADALKSAENAKEEMAKLQADNQKLLKEARLERDKLLKEATDIANKIKEEAKSDAAKQADKIIADAKSAIEIEKNAALKEVTTKVAQLSLEIAEKLVRKNLSDDKAQKALAEDFMKDLKLN